MSLFLLFEAAHSQDGQQVRTESGSAAWPRCTGSRHTTTAMYREVQLPGPDAPGAQTHNQSNADLALTERDSGAGCGLWQFSRHSVGSETPLTTTML